MKLKIEYVDINSIRPYEKNPRHNEEAIPYVMNSIKEFGFKNPIIIDKNNVIIAGHTRLESAKRLGMNEVPIIHADDLNEEQIKAFRLADNKVSEYATWNDNLLNIELQDLDIDMSDFGFDMDISLDDDEAYSFEDKKEEYKNEIDPSSILYIGAVSIFGDSGDTICYYDIDKDLANKLLEIIKKNGEDYVNKKLVEALNDL